MDRDTNQPHLLRLVGAEDLPSQYFVVVEQVVLMEVGDIMRGLYMLLALHYVFDIAYHPQLADLFLFCEDKVLCISTPSLKKSVTYLSVTSAIECFLDHTVCEQ